MQEKKQLPGWLLACLFPAVLFYYEVVFRVSTSQSFPLEGTVYMLLFSICYAGIGYLAATLSGRKPVNYIVTLLWLILSVAPFLVEYFVYRQFKIYYDLNTCFNGAADALSDFLRELCMMIFSWDGISRIFLFLLPTGLFAIFGWRCATPRKLRLRSWLITALALVLVFLLTGYGLSGSPALSLICGKEYNFQGVVSNLGLMTGLRLDVSALISEDTPEDFEIVATIPQVIVPATAATIPSDSTVPAESEPVIYTPNVMDIDFDALPQNGTLGQLNAYVSSLTPSTKNEYTGMFAGKNLIFITAEAFTAEVIDPELTPTLYRLATRGIQFTDYYQPASAGTTGGEYQNIFGMLPGKGGASFRLTQRHLNYFTMGNQLDRLGYYGIAYHNHTNTYYDRHLTHNNLGYSEGFIGEGNGMEAHLSKIWPKSDLEMFTATVPTYLDKQPFNVYYMTFSGHSGYSTAENALTKKHWDRVKDLDRSKQVRGYLAAQLELEDALTYLVGELEAAGIADNTVICISTDHFPYGLDTDGGWSGKHSSLSDLYGYPVETYLDRDHSRLILWCGSLEDEEPIVVDTPTSSLDILPTLSNLFGTEFDSRLMVGRDVFSDAPALMFNAFYDWKTEYGTYIAADSKFYPADASIEIPEGYVDAIKIIVRNKIRYCRWVLETDYFRYLFGEK